VPPLIGPRRAEVDPLLPVEPLQFQGQVSERTGHSVLSLEDKSSAKPVTSADFSATVEQ